MSATKIKHGDVLPMIGGPLDGRSHRAEKVLYQVFGEDAPLGVIIHNKKHVYRIDEQTRAWVYSGRAKASPLKNGEEPGKSISEKANIDDIIDRVCELLDVDEALVIRKGKRDPVQVFAKELILMIAYPRGWWSHPTLARRMNIPNHSTTITALRRAEAKLESGEVVGLDQNGRPVTMADAIRMAENDPEGRITVQRKTGGMQ